jgi:hypothetical protein
VERRHELSERVSPQEDTDDKAYEMRAPTDWRHECFIKKKVRGLPAHAHADGGRELFFCVDNAGLVVGGVFEVILCSCANDADERSAG